jgi:hypothetical protein
MTVVAMDPGLQRELVALDRERDALLSVIEKDAVSDQPSDRERAVRVSTQLRRLRKERTALRRDHNLQVAAVAGVATAAGSAVAPVLLPSVGRTRQAPRNGAAANVLSFAGELSEMAKLVDVAVREVDTNSSPLGDSGAPRDEARARGLDALKGGQKLEGSVQGLQSSEAGKQFAGSMAPTQKFLVNLATQTDATGTETATTAARTDVKVTDLKKEIGVTRTRAVRRTRAKAADLGSKADTTSFRGFVCCKILAIVAAIASFFLFLGWKLGMCQKRVEG